MAKFLTFVGPTSTHRAHRFNMERTINFYLERADRGTPKSPAYLNGTMGMRRFAWLGAGPVRGLFEQDGRLFAVGGAYLFEVFVNGAVVVRGQVAVDGNPATIASNGEKAGHQLIVTSGGRGYIFDLEDNSFTQITDESFPNPCSMVIFFDGYFIALNAITGVFSLSELEDGINWNGLDVGQESQASDITRAIIRTHDNLWLFGYKHTAPWHDIGDASFPFAPIQGAIIEHGIHAIYSVCQFDNTLFWLGRDKDGCNQVWRANGYIPMRISTHAIEYELDRFERTDDSLAFTYQHEGHGYYQLLVPKADTSFVYDVKENEWHERALWNPDIGNWVPDVPRCHAFAFNRHIFGDRRSGGLYEGSLDVFHYDLFV